MTDPQPTSPNAREVEYWNSAPTRSWAERHEQIDRLFAGLTKVAMDLAAPRPGERVLDIGCGSGTTVLELGGRVGPSGHVLGADIAKLSVERARERIGASAIHHVEVVLSDVSTHAFPPGSFDLAFSRFGVMFFTDPTATFANIRRALQPSGRMTLAVFRTPQENPWGTAPVAAVRHLLPPLPSPGPEDPGQFSWADQARVHRILEGAGFRDISLTPHDPAMRLAGPGGAEDAADFAFHIGPVLRATSNATAEQRDKVRSALVTFFKSQEGPNGIIMPGAIWIVRASA
jgi:SAM-dependent methyltransferase